ncbi:MAG: hypothetical protein K6T61_01635 [Bryobacteraceae bacterium]|nr:hypothetical protein [Bryobacteraceae bacterium]
MITVESYPLAVVLCVLTMISWGSWANTQKLAARTWRFELFYWDFISGFLPAWMFSRYLVGLAARG